MAKLTIICKNCGKKTRIEIKEIDILRREVSILREENKKLKNRINDYKYDNSDNIDFLKDIFKFNDK